MTAETIDDVTPEWLSGSLQRAGYDCVVAGVATQRIGTGQTGTTYRLSIQYADGTAAPSRLVAKLAAEDPAKRIGAAFGYQQEVKFYQHVLPTVGVRAPVCYCADISEDGTSFTLLLEDLTPAVPGVQADGCSVAQATTVARNAADLHAPRWNDPTLKDLGLLDYTAVSESLGAYQAVATEKFIEYLGHRLSAADIATLREAAQLASAFLTTRSAPFSVIHGDYRLDNLMFHPDGKEIITVDWQTLSLGPGPRDVAYFLGTSMSTEARREHEKSIVESYHAELVALGVSDYDADQCFDDYRLGVLWAPQITTIGAMGAPEERAANIDEMFLAMATRSCAAIRDLDSFDLVA